MREIKLPKLFLSRSKASFSVARAAGLTLIERKRTMRFKPRTTRVANPIGRRESRMLFALVMLLGFVVVAIGYVANPESWLWFFDRGGDTHANPQKSKDTNRDTRLRTPAEKPTIEGQFTLVQANAPPPPPEDNGDFYPGVNTALLARIEDNRPLTHREVEPWSNLMHVLKDSDQNQLRKASTGDVGFLQLHDQPHVYRGKLVSLEGTAMRAYYRKSDTDADGVDRYFIIWLMLSGGPPRPIIIYCQEKPEGFPEGESIHESVRTTGFFFKKRAYAATDSFRAAPVVLAKSFRWKKAKVQSSWNATDEQLVWMFLGAAAFALLVVAVVHWRSRQMFSGRRRTAGAETGAPLAAMDDDQVMPSIGQQLTEIAEKDTK